MHRRIRIFPPFPPVYTFFAFYLDSFFAYFLIAVCRRIASKARRAAVLARQLARSRLRGERRGISVSRARFAPRGSVIVVVLRPNNLLYRVPIPINLKIRTSLNGGCGVSRATARITRARVDARRRKRKDAGAAREILRTKDIPRAGSPRADVIPLRVL